MEARTLHCWLWDGWHQMLYQLQNAKHLNLATEAPHGRLWWHRTRGSGHNACMCCITQAAGRLLQGTNLLELLEADVCLVPWLPHPEVALQGLQELGLQDEAGGRPMCLVDLQEQRLQLLLQPSRAA